MSMTIDEAIAHGHSQWLRGHCYESAANLSDALLIAANGHGSKAAGYLLATHHMNYITFSARVEAHWQQHCKPPGPESEWVEVEPWHVAGTLCDHIGPVSLVSVTICTQEDRQGVPMEHIRVTPIIGTGRAELRFERASGGDDS